MPLYNAGNAYLQVVPSFKGIEALMKRELAKLGAQVDQSLGDAVSGGMGDGAKRGSEKVKEQVQKDAEDAAGAFAAKFEKRVGSMLKQLGGEVEIGANTKDFDEKFNKIVQDAKALSEKKIGPEFSAKDAAKDMDDLSRRMRELEQNAPDLERKFNLRQARAEADSFFQDLRANGGTSGAEFGRRFSGAMNEELRKGAEGALHALPELKIDADSTPAQRKVADLRALLERLHADIQLGLSDEVAMSRMRVIVGELEYLDRFEADPSVSVNSAAALAKLEAVRKMMDSIDGDQLDVKVDVDSGAASNGLRQIGEESGVTLSRLGYLTSFGAALGTALVPAAAAAAVAISGIGFAAAGAAAGVGTLFLAFNGVGDAVKALHAYNQDAAKSAKSLSQSTNAIASAMDSVKSSQDQLANARDNAAKRERDNQGKLKSAIENVNQQRLKGVQAVKDATLAAIDSDRKYTEAMADAKVARLALNQAYRDAARDLADLNSQVQHNALDQRQAALDLAKAKEELDKIMTNPRATTAEREQATITYQERVLQIEDLARKGQQLQDQQVDANKKGIEGSDKVVAAKRKIIDADAAVTAAANAQAKAQAKLKAEQIAAPEAIAAAELSLKNLRLDIAKDRNSDTRAIAAAQRSIAASNRQLAQSYTSASVAGGAAMNTLRKKMEDLGPAGQAFVYFLDREMRPALSKVQDAAQAGLFPGLTAGLRDLISGGALKTFSDFIFNVAKAMGDSFQYAVQQLKDPVWKKFFGYIGQTAGPVIRGATTVALNFAKGIANIMNALTGFNGGMGKGLIDFSSKFVTWSQKLTQSDGFQKFMAYVKQEGPHVVGLLKQVAIFAWRIVVASAPIGAIVVRAFEAFFAILNKIPTKDLMVIIGAIVGLSVVLLGLAAATAIAFASTATLVTLLVVGIGAGLAVLYNHFKPFKTIVDATFRAVGNTILWLWKNVWIPFYTALWHGIVWLYKNVFVPYFQGLITRIVNFGQHVAALWPIIRPGVLAIGNGIKWLYEKAIKPALGAIGAAFQWVWFKVIKPVLSWWNSDSQTISKQQSGIWKAIEAVLRGFAATVGWIWNNILKPVLTVLGAVLVFLWKFVVVPVFQGIVIAVQVAWAILSFIFNAIVAVIKVVAAVIGWLYKNVVQPILTAMGISFSIFWALVKVVFGLIQIALKILGLAFKWLYTLFVKPYIDLAVIAFRIMWAVTKQIAGWISDKLSWLGGKIKELYVKYVQPWLDRIGNKVKDLYNSWIKPWVDKIANIWTDRVVPAWDKAVGAIGKIWDKLRAAPKNFIKWIVVDVLNGGLLSGYNRVAKFFKVKPDDVQIKLPKGFAVGGEIAGPGTGTSDSVLIRASKGEHMMTAAEVAALGGHGQVYAMRRAIMAGWKPPGFARGGAIDDGTSAVLGIGTWLKKQAKSVGKKAVGLFDSASSFFADPVGSLQALLQGLLAKMPSGGADAAKVMVGMPQKVLGTLVDKLKSFVGLGPDTNAGSGTGAGGWAWQERVLKAAFGDKVNFTSTTGGGHAKGSWHYLGRALDSIGPDMMAIFNWIMSHFGKTSKELIYSPAGQGIKNGQLVDIRSFYGPDVFANHYCVPMDTEILTRRGWLTYDQLVDGDETLGFNFETEKTEWTKVLGIVKYDDAELFEARSHSWSVRTTGGHRWVAQDRKTGRYYWNTTGGDREGDGAPQKYLRKHTDTWVIAAQMADGPGLQLDLDEAELIGWLVTDGGQHDGFHNRGNNFSVHVWQTKPAGVLRLGEILTDRASYNGKGYRLRNAYARDLMKRARVTHIKSAPELLSMITEMTGEQRQAMLAGVIGGDGRLASAPKSVNPSWQIMQDEGPLLDVITTLAYACGYRTTVTKHGCSKNCWQHNGNPMIVNLGRPKVSTFNQGRVSVGNAPVWCPTTELGTWTARFGNNVVLTGNSHVHWAYDQGGMLQPGYSTVYNGTGKPEPVLTSKQWNAITAAPRNYDGPHEVHHWETAGTTITPAWLEANQRRRDALSRINRRNH